ncbi:hypothetical protein MMC22_005054 [Lobaria immixta]|nr:hypothetical protein [Lobaria immixta]
MRSQTPLAVLFLLLSTPLLALPEGTTRANHSVPTNQSVPAIMFVPTNLPEPAIQPVPTNLLNPTYSPVSTPLSVPTIQSVPTLCKADRTTANVNKWLSCKAFCENDPHSKESEGVAACTKAGGCDGQCDSLELLPKTAEEIQQAGRLCAPRTPGVYTLTAWGRCRANCAFESSLAGYYSDDPVCLWRDGCLGPCAAEDEPVPTTAAEKASWKRLCGDQDQWTNCYGDCIVAHNEASRGEDDPDSHLQSFPFRKTDFRVDWCRVDNGCWACNIGD